MRVSAAAASAAAALLLGACAAIPNTAATTQPSSAVHATKSRASSAASASAPAASATASGASAAPGSASTASAAPASGTSGGSGANAFAGAIPGNFPGSVLLDPNQLPASNHAPMITATTQLSTHLGKVVKGVYELIPTVHPDPAASPLPSNLLIADGSANRILEVNAQKQIVWQMTGLADPDDIQVYAPGELLVNQENDNRVVAIDMATKSITWSYGSLGAPAQGAAAAGLTGAGHVNNPDDSFQLPNGNVLIDDANNQRVIAVNKAGQVVWQYGTIDPKTHIGVPGTIPGYLIGPNDDVPQPDGNLLITNVGNDTVPNSHNVTEITPAGRTLWTMVLPAQYPSDALKMPDGSILVADWVSPGHIYLFGPGGHLRWNYTPTGANQLNHPSSAQLLSNGDVLICDDHNDRIIVVQPTGPTSGTVVWQYGQTGVAGTGPGQLADASGVIPVTPALNPAEAAPGFNPAGNGGQP